MSTNPAMRLDRRALLRAAAAMPLLSAAPGRGLWLPSGDERTLVVLELEGGNDGLNTVLPLDDGRWASARPNLQVVRKGALRLEGGVALHPMLAQLHRAVVGGAAAVVHAVGYPSPDRSHFRSRDIWHVADPTHQRVGTETTGWLGRAADLLATAGAGMPAASLGGVQVPLVLKSRRVVVPSLQRAEDFELQVQDGPGAAAHRIAMAELVASRSDAGLLGAIGATAVAGAALSEQLRAALQRYQSRAEYPDSQLGKDLQLAARMAVAGFGMRLFHVVLGGFDTHARQLPTHASLLQQLDAALGAFLVDLEAHGRLQSTAVFVHSEFGRRVAENQSQGTDHGAAAPVFLCGGAVRGGQHGERPDLGDLDDGDVKATTDFRQLYADLLGWLGVDAASVLGPGFRGLGLIAP